MNSFRSLFWFDSQGQKPGQPFPGLEKYVYGGARENKNGHAAWMKSLPGLSESES